MAIAKERAKIPADSGVELVTYPAPKSLFELLRETTSPGASDAAASAWMSAHLTEQERIALRAMRVQSTMFKRGEILALMPFSYVR